MPLNIQILGQRCSGTNFLHVLLANNFEGIKIVSRLGNKHCWNAKLKRALTHDPRIKVIIIVRNPYDWLRSVHRQPHHAPELLGLPFSEFLIAPWQAYKSEGWNHADRKIRLKGLQKVRLLESFNNILEMRNKKNELFISILETYNNSLLINYEHLVARTEEVIQEIAQFLNRPKPQKIQKAIYYKKTDKVYKPMPMIKISESNLKDIRQSIDWSLENKLGYSSDQYSYDTVFTSWRYRFLLKQWIYENLRKHSEELPNGIF